MITKIITVDFNEVIILNACFFFCGWMVGATLREKRLKQRIAAEQANIYAEAAKRVMNKEIEKRDNLILKGVWQAQREYIKIMLDCVDRGFTMDEMRTMFAAQLDLVDQELAIEETKTILL